MQTKFYGSLVALVTPLRDGLVDETGLRELIEWHIANGTDGLVPCGTTGESATLSHEEHERVVEITIQSARGRIPVIAGTGSNSTKEAIRLTKSAQQAGADAALLISPYYNKPTQEGLYQHFKAISEAVDIPLFLYNIPGRTAVNILPATIARIAELKNVIGVKEATGDLKQVAETIAVCPNEFIILSGDDYTTLPLLAIGGKGVISVVANVVPKETAAMLDAWFAGNLEEAKRLHYHLLPLTQVMFLETNPIPVKTALWLMGKIDAEMRLPLYQMSNTNLGKLKELLNQYKIL
ncbi:MAG: 4-hydroxy-tetrahydrodipicolinate synthase [bacterium]|nr:4-hydroxy-tetrahydrodipicolinate synthase [bacterium]